jgi:hypothetical protein
MTLSESHTRRWSGPLTRLGAMVLLCAASAVSAGPTVYTYVDDEGTTIFTEQPQSIPERYRDRVQVMSRAEEEQLERQAKEAREKKATGLGGIGSITGLTGGGKPQSSRQPAAAADVVQEAAPGTESAPSPLSFLPPLTDYQKAVMGVGFGVAVILYVMMKMNRSFGVRLFLRLLLMIVLFGTSYMVYFSGLSEKFAEMTGQGAAAGGKGGFQSPTELLKQAKEAAQQMQRSQQETVNVLQQMEKE